MIPKNRLPDKIRVTIKSEQDGVMMLVPVEFIPLTKRQLERIREELGSSGTITPEWEELYNLIDEAYKNFGVRHA